MLSNLLTLLSIGNFSSVDITLDGDIEVQTAVCTAQGEFVNAILSSIRDQKQRPFEVTPELEKWLLKPADKPTMLTHDDFSRVRERTSNTGD